MPPPWDDLRATLAEMGEVFGEDAVKDLESEGCVDAANALRGAIKGEPRGAGGEAAAAAWARLQTGVGWNTSAWRECYVLGQLREATEAGEAASRVPVGSPSATTAAASASASPRATRPPSPMKDATPSYDAPFSRWTWRTSWAAPRRSFSASAARWSPSCARVEQPSTQTNPPPTWGCSYPSSCPLLRPRS